MLHMHELICVLLSHANSHMRHAAIKGGSAAVRPINVLSEISVVLSHVAHTVNDIGKLARTSVAHTTHNVCIDTA